ncbi:TPA: type VI secretion system Vgr family protein [Pluralibacter gergoviae]
MSNNPLNLLFNHSHHLLSVKGCTAPLDVLAFEGEEALSRPFSYRIEFTSADHAITRQQMLLKPASLTLQAPVMQAFGARVQQPLRVIQGAVTGLERLGTSRDETHYALTLQPRLALLDRTRQNAIYQDMSVPQIVEKILRERHNMRGQDFLFSLSNEYPRREQVMQYGEDDLHFITRLLGEVGIWFRFTTDARLNIDVVEFYDAQQGYGRGLTLPSVPLSGQQAEGADAVWGMTCRERVVTQRVSTRDYNYRSAPADMNARADVTRGDATTYGEDYRYADNYLTQGDAPESGTFCARIAHERHLNDQSALGGVTSHPGLSPGQVLKVTGGTEVPDAFRKGVLITQLRSRARRDRDLEVDFSGIPDSTDYGFRPQPGKRPVMAGTLPARVTSTAENDIYGHIDKDGRYRVNLLFDRAQWETGFESLWVRQSRPYAGDTYGLHLPLLAGTEVAIGFEDGNPDRPYIAGVLHDSAHPDHVTIENYRRNVLRTPANNKIRLDDTRGREHIKVSTEYGGKSQLNLGHLVDSERKPRGEGFELRTDRWGAIRAQKGIFISADGQPKAQGLQREMQAALKELDAAREVTSGLRHAAQAAQAELADLEKQTVLMNQTLNDLKQQALLLSAPSGIAQVTPASVQISAGEDVIVTAGKNTDLSIAKRFTLAVGDILSLFAHKLGIKMYASEGKVDIQAQSDALNLFSKQQLSIASSDNSIVISAKKEILLVCGGSFIRLSDAGVEVGTGKNVTLKCIAVQQQSAATLNSRLTLPSGCKPGVISAAQQQGAVVDLS